MNQVILNNGMRTNAENIQLRRGKRTKLFGKKFEKELLVYVDKLSGRDMKARGFANAMGYSPKSANATVRINKTLRSLEERNIIRSVKGSEPYTKRYYRKMDDEALHVEEVFEEHERTTVLSEEVPVTETPKVAATSVADLIVSLKEAGLNFTITISNHDEPTKHA